MVQAAAFPASRARCVITTAAARRFPGALLSFPFDDGCLRGAATSSGLAACSAARRPSLPLSTCWTARSSPRTCSAIREGHQEFIRFLNRIDREVPDDTAIHVILDNYAAHKKDKVRAWLARHPRWTFHFTPTSCSWLNAVEGFFAKLTRRRLKHGVFHSVVDLQAAINRFVLQRDNQRERPYCLIEQCS